MGDGFEGPHLEKLVLNGRFAVYAMVLYPEKYQGEGTSWRVLRLNAQTGRREEVGAVGEKGGGFGEKSPGVTDVVVTPTGTAAWIIDGEYQNPSGPSLPGNQGDLPLGSKSLFELPPGAKTPVVLATSSTIDPTSLKAIPGHLYWTEGGVAHTASIQ